jgi:hypothetical protein
MTKGILLRGAPTAATGDGAVGAGGGGGAGAEGDGGGDGRDGGMEGGGGAGSSFWVGAPSAATGVPQARQKALLGARALPHLPQTDSSFITAVRSSSGSAGAGGSYFAPHERQKVALAASCSPHFGQERSPPSGACVWVSVIPSR